MADLLEILTNDAGLTAAQFGVGPVWIGGVRYWGDGSSFISASIVEGSAANVVYNPDGTIASGDFEGKAFVFTWAAGKIATVVSGGVTKTYSWSGDELVSVVVS